MERNALGYIPGDQGAITLRGTLRRRPTRHASAGLLATPRVARYTGRGSTVGHTFQSFWWGEALSPYERLCLQSFVDRGHAFDLYTFDPDISVPKGVRVRDASEILGWNAFFVYPDGPGKGSPAGFANLFRYKLLHDRGGWWVDTDVVCLSDEIPSFEEFFAWQDALHVNCAVLFSRPGDPVMANCFERALDMGRMVQWADTGPLLLTEILAQTDGLGRALPASVCYPVHFSAAVDVFRPSRRDSLAPCIDSSLFWHLWNSMLMRGGIRKHCLPPRGSLLRELVDRHPVDGWTGEYDEQLLEQTLSSSAAMARLDEKYRALDAELIRVQAELAGTRTELAEQQAALAERDAELGRAQATLAELLDSTSWRVTAPLRAVGLRYPRLRGVVKAVRTSAASRSTRR
jgi:hypothetical protein